MLLILSIRNGYINCNKRMLPRVRRWKRLTARWRKCLGIKKPQKRRWATLCGKQIISRYSPCCPLDCVCSLIINWLLLQAKVAGCKKQLQFSEKQKRDQEAYLVELQARALATKRFAIFFSLINMLSSTVHSSQCCKYGTRSRDRRETARTCSDEGRAC